MFTPRSTRPTLWILVALLAARGLAAYDAALAADQDTTASAKATLKIKPNKLDFGTVAVGQDSAAKTVSATNESKSDSIHFASIVASAPFKLKSNACSGSPLPAGKSCKIEVVFHPAAVAPVMEKNGLTFSDSANESPQAVILAGMGHHKKPTPTTTATATPTATATATLTMTPTPIVSGTPTVTARATPTATTTPKPEFSGHVMSGSAPVSGAQVTTWAVGSTGYGMGATKLPTSWTSGADGFYASGIFGCPSDTAQIYVMAQGGNAGGGNNSSLLMMAMVGQCDTIGFSSKTVAINDVTTAASVYALAHFLSTTSPGSLGAPSTNAGGFADALATVRLLVDPTTGVAASTSGPGVALPQENLNSIANAMAACDQTAGASSPACTELFDCALPGAMFSAGACSGGTGSVSDTLSAALSIALNPGDVSVAGSTTLRANRQRIVRRWPRRRMTGRCR